MENLFETKGIDLKKVIEEAKEKGNTAFAELVEKQIPNVQTCYDIMAQKYTSTGGDIWNIDTEYLKGMLK